MTDLHGLLAVLRETHTLTLATIDADGSPRATPVYFAVGPDPDQVSSGNLVWPFFLLFLSDPDAPHGQNLSRDPRAAVALYPAETDWRSLRGVQMKGHVDHLSGDEAAQALGDYRREIAISPELEAAVMASALYRFLPRWARLIDNRLGFGHKQEWTWP